MCWAQVQRYNPDRQRLPVAKLSVARGNPRVVRLAHQGSTETGESANGRLVASAGPVFLSKDEGKHWSQIGQVTLPDEVAQLCCSTLYEMPRTVGQLQEGTLLRAGSYCIGPGAANPCRGTGGVPAIVIFTSRDQGRTWKYYSTPVRASVNTAGGLWEPEFEIAQDQSLVMFWSDETHSCCKGQQLRQIRTTDGVSWRDEKANRCWRGWCKAGNGDRAPKSNHASLLHDL